MNEELQLIAELLADTSLITSLELDSEWLENAAAKKYLIAIERLKGMSYTPEQVYKEVRTIDLFNAGTVDEIEMLQGSATGELEVEEACNRLHLKHVDNLLAQASQEYIMSRSQKHFEEMQRLAEQRADIAVVKSDGHLQKAFVEFSESLEKESEAIETYKPLDNLLGGGITGGKLIVMAGRPATGKTALALNLMERAFEQNENIACDFFTFEMGQNELITRLVSKKTKINSMLFLKKNQLSLENKQKSRQAYMKMLRDYDLRVFTSEYSKLNDIKAAIKKNRNRNKHYIAFIDYAGLITVNDSRKNERQVMNEVTRELKKLTTDYDITIILLAQLSRAVEARSDGKPVLSDLKESGSLEQDANVVLLLSADKNDRRKISCEVAKNREGMLGVAPFIFEQRYMDFSIDFDIWRG
jgi:replicative DNA helicase